MLCLLDVHATSQCTPVYVSCIPGIHKWLSYYVRILIDSLISGITYIGYNMITHGLPDKGIHSTCAYILHASGVATYI